MADFGGFQVKTPQEVLAELQATQQQIQQIRDPGARRTANIQFQMSNLFGNPELKKAQQTEQQIKMAQEHFAKQYKGADAASLEGQSARLQLMYDAVKGIDPTAASQIQSQLAAIDAERFERGRLVQADRRSDAYLGIAQDQNARSEELHGRIPDWSDVGYAIDANNPNSKPQIYDLTDPESNAAYQKAVADGMMGLSHEEAFERLGRVEAREQYKSMLNKSAFEKKLTGYDAQNQYLDKATKMISRFRVNPETGLLIMDVKRGISNLAAEARAAIRVGGWTDEQGNPLDEAATRHSITAQLEKWEKAGELKIAQEDRALFEAAVLNMGYVLARSLDSGGRLSDQDVNMAIKMLTGGSALFEDGTISVPADQLVSVLYDRALDIYDLMQPDSIDGIFVQERADLGDEQAMMLRTVRQSTMNKFNVLDAQAKKTLPDYLYKRVRSTYDPDYLTDPERRQMERDEWEATRSAETREKLNSGPSHKIFRPDQNLEKQLGRNQAIYYDRDGNPRVVPPEEIGRLMKSIKPGERLRLKTAAGDIQDITPESALQAR